MKQNKPAVFLFLTHVVFGGQEGIVSQLSQKLSNKYDVFVVLFDIRVINFPIYGAIFRSQSG